MQNKRKRSESGSDSFEMSKRTKVGDQNFSDLPQDIIFHTLLFMGHYDFGKQFSDNKSSKSVTLRLIREPMWIFTIILPRKDQVLITSNLGSIVLVNKLWNKIISGQPFWQSRCNLYWPNVSDTDRENTLEGLFRRKGPATGTKVSICSVSEFFLTSVIKPSSLGTSTTAQSNAIIIVINPY